MKLVFTVFFLKAYRIFSLSLVFQNFVMLVPFRGSIFNLYAWHLVSSFDTEIHVFQFLEIFWNYFLDNFLLYIVLVLSFWELLLFKCWTC